MEAPRTRGSACYGVLRFVMESGAKGCEVIVSGKLRAQRAKSMKFKDGYMARAAPARPVLCAEINTMILLAPRMRAVFSGILSQP